MGDVRIILHGQSASGEMDVRALRTAQLALRSDHKVGDIGGVGFPDDAYYGYRITKTGVSVWPQKREARDG